MAFSYKSFITVNTKKGFPIVCFTWHGLSLISILIDCITVVLVHVILPVLIRLKERAPPWEGHAILTLFINTPFISIAHLTWHVFCSLSPDRLLIYCLTWSVQTESSSLSMETESKLRIGTPIKHAHKPKQATYNGELASLCRQMLWNL